MPIETSAHKGFRQTGKQTDKIETSKKKYLSLVHAVTSMCIVFMLYPRAATES